MGAPPGVPTSFDVPPGFAGFGPGSLPVAVASWGDPSGGALARPSMEPLAGIEAPAIADAGKAQAEPPAAPAAAVYEFQPQLSPQTVPVAGDAVPAAGASAGIFDPYSVKRDFPILRERVRGRPLVWLDNAATTQKPQAVIDRLSYFYEHENSNVHRAAHTLAARATDAYEGAREKVRRFLGAPSSREIVFVRGATEGINLVAQSWGRRNVGPGDEIVITWLEHHANIVPWQILAAERDIELRWVGLTPDGQLDLTNLDELLDGAKAFSFSAMSNVLGTITPVRRLTDAAHDHGAVAVVDAC